MHTPDVNPRKEPIVGANGDLKEQLLTILVLAVSHLLNAVISLYFVEMVSRQASKTAMAFVINQSPLFIAETLFFLALGMSISLLTRRPSASLFACNLFFLLLAAVHLFKKQLRGEPLLLTDFGQTKEALQILPQFHLFVPRYLIVVAFVLLIAIPGVFIGFRLRLPLKERIFLLLISIVLTAFSGFHLVSIPLHVPFQYDLLYDTAGFLRGLWETKPKWQLNEPPDYDKHLVLSALGGHTCESLPPDAVKPDIVFIMSESLFDLYRLNKLDMTVDPLASFKALQKEYAGADYISPNLGGGTFASEYEVLTGYRASDTPGALFNNHAVTKDGMDTVVSTLKQAGYHTVAMHPHGSSFYNRAFNYRRFGFDELLFDDTGLPKIEERIGGYPADGALFACAEQAYEQRDPEKPWFAHIVTYQNHGSYAYDYDRRDIEVLNRDGTEKKASENYANAVLTHVEALEQLFSYFSKQDSPVVVVVWGDHAPNVQEFGISFGTGANTAPFYRTPLLVWNNYGASFELDETLPAYRLGAYILNGLGFRTDAYFNWLSDAQPNLVSALHMIEKDGNVLSDSDAFEAADQKLLLFHYDRLLGEQYWKEALAP